MTVYSFCLLNGFRLFKLLNEKIIQGTYNYFENMFSTNQIVGQYGHSVMF